MHAKSIITSVSAAALAASLGGLGVANAAPQQTSQQTNSQSQQGWNHHHQKSSMTGMSGMQSQPQEVASQAAMVLRKNEQANMQSGQQSGQMQSETTSQQIPQQVVAAARCVAVFPSNAAMTTTGATGEMGANGTTKTAGSENRAMGTMGNAGTNGGTTGNSSMHNSMHMRTASNERVGVASCRNDNGQWTKSSPVFVRISKLHLMNASMRMSGNGAMSGQTGQTGQTGMNTGANSSYAKTGSNNTYAQTGEQTGTNTAETGQQGMNEGANSYGSTSMHSHTGNALVLVFVNDDAASTLQSGDFTLGDDVDVTAGPTNLQHGGTVSAPVLAYTSSSQGGFTGANIKGAEVQFDKQANQQIYGHDADPEDLLKGNGNNSQGQSQSRLTAFNQALSQFAPSSKYNSNTSIVK